MSNTRSATSAAGAGINIPSLTVDQLRQLVASGVTGPSSLSSITKIEKFLGEN